MEASFSMRHVWAGVAGSAAMLGAGAAEAAFTPPSLPPGSGYRIIFTSSGTTTAVSTAIADYNAFVTGQAALNPDLPTTTWKAIGSTDAVSAVANIDCGATCNDLPIYNVNGVKVANSTADFFDGSILVALSTDQNGGEPEILKSWTGSAGSGLQFAGSTLGSASVRTGYTSFTSGGRYLSDWTFFSPGVHFLAYGISGALSIPDQTVPAPGGIALLLLGLGALGAVGTRRDRTLH